jgi:hypothetical protein
VAVNEIGKSTGVQECRVIRPVLKHGLRSSLHVQEFGCMKSLARNESKEHSCNVLSVISVIW